MSSAVQSNLPGVTRRAAIAGGALATAGVFAASSRPSWAEEASAAGVHMAPGSYVGTAPGLKQMFDLPVTVTVTENAIVAISVPQDRFAHGETVPILNSVRDRMFPEVIANQSLEVDTVTGATSSSLSCKNAIEDALEQALTAGGLDETAVQTALAAFHTPVPKAEEGVVEEVSVDILVVGLSIGGCFALKRATQMIQTANGNNRVSVMAIDHAGKVGGRSSLTHMMQSVNPRYCVENFNDGQDYIDKDAYYDLWMQWITDEETGEPMADPEIIRMFIDNSGDTLDWQVENGWGLVVPAEDGCQPGIVTFHTAPAPMVQPGTFEDRRNLVDQKLRAFVAYAESMGARVELETEGYEFIYDEATSTVRGVKARNTRTGKEYVISARAVLMGTGGFGSNSSMMETYLNPPFNGYYPCLGTGTDTGLMVQAAINIGAGTRNIGMSPIVMHLGLPHFLNKYPINVDKTSLNQFTGRYSTWTLNDLPLGLGLSANQLAITKSGERFCDEAQVMALFTQSIHDSGWPAYRLGTEGFYSVWSQAMLEKVAAEGLNHVTRWEVYQCQGNIPKETPLPELFEVLDETINQGMAWKGETLEELAGQIGVDPDILSATVADYDAMCSAGEDTAFGKSADSLEALGAGPYYAIELVNVIFATCGGLTVDSQIRVCQTDDKTPINGLYAFGCDSLGNLVNPKMNYTVFPAIAAGWNQTGGRLAAENAVAYVIENYGLTDVGYQTLPEGFETPESEKPMW